MPIIDVQVHPYERNSPERPWAGQAHALQSATGDEAFEREVGLELLVETARLWRSLGHHDSEGRFRIGPFHIPPAELAKSLARQLPRVVRERAAQLGARRAR